MMEIQLLSSSKSETPFSVIIPCDQCSDSFEDEYQLQTHVIQAHVRSKRNGRTFSYALNPKRAKTKLLKGAKRKHLEVEIK